MRNESMS